jgi:3-oxoacyl-[acyl-carrier protein] reductase
MIEGLGWNVATGLDPRPLAGRTALVTGSLGGLGRPMTAALAAAGARVAVHHLGQPDEAEAFVRELRAESAEAIAVEADVLSWDSVETALATIEASLGAVTILVNNAGFMRKQRVLDMTLQDWEKTIDLDLNAFFTVTRLALPAMIAAGGGSVISVSSQLASKGAFDYVSYSAAKAGVVGMTRALARELGPNVRFNAIAPGPVDTPMTREYSTPEWVKERTEGSVIGRLGDAEEIAPAVVFLAGPGASLFHGQTFHVNGGGVMS